MTRVPIDLVTRETGVRILQLAPFGAGPTAESGVLRGAVADNVELAPVAAAAVERLERERVDREQSAGRSRRTEGAPGCAVPAREIAGRHVVDAWELAGDRKFRHAALVEDLHRLDAVQRPAIGRH